MKKIKKNNITKLKDDYLIYGTSYQYPYFLNNTWNCKLNGKVLRIKAKKKRKTNFDSLTSSYNKIPKLIITNG